MMMGMSLATALRSLRANKLRSALSLLGIIIGVFAVVLMLSIGAGTRKQVLDRIAAMGTDLLILRPGQRGTGGVISGTQQNLTVEDAQALVGIHGVKQVSPVVGGSAQLKHLNRNSRVSVQGVALTYLPIRDSAVEFGRCFTEVETESMARVAVIGPVTATNLFGEDDPLDQMIKLNGINFRVVGVLKSKGDQGFFNPDDQVLIPYLVAMQQVFGLTRLREIDLQGVENGNLAAVQAEATAILRKRHRISGTNSDDFMIQNMADLQETFSNMSLIMTIMLGSIGGISLLVGGIGIMNIMLVTVTERTREIGLRKAIGARNRDILWQFLIEAVVVTMLGGVIGVGSGVAGALAIAASGFMTPLVTPLSIILALSFATAIGIFFGWYPASRAAQLDPIEALRYE
jgi:putative ABC transport system permease protein